MQKVIGMLIFLLQGRSAISVDDTLKIITCRLDDCIEFQF